LRGAQLDLVCTPSFVVVAIGESERTAISLLVNRHKLEEKVAVED
jgi:stage V sporulation protein SpoVS